MKSYLLTITTQYFLNILYWFEERNNTPTTELFQANQTVDYTIVVISGNTQHTFHLPSHVSNHPAGGQKVIINFSGMIKVPVNSIAAINLGANPQINGSIHVCGYYE